MMIELLNTKVFDNERNVLNADLFVSNLKHNYFDQGLDSPSKIGTKYCPVNPQWASMVERLM